MRVYLVGLGMLGASMLSVLSVPVNSHHRTLHPLQATQAVHFFEDFKKAQCPGASVISFELQAGSVCVSGQLYVGDVHLRMQLPDRSLLIERPIDSSGARAWVFTEGVLKQLAFEQLFEPIMPDVRYTPYDIALGFVDWPRVQYVGSGYLQGRPAHTFVLEPSEAIAQALHAVHSIRLVVDADFYALLKAEWLDAGGRVLRTLKVRNFKKSDHGWFCKNVDLIEAGLGQTTRLVVTQVNFQCSIPDAVFEPKMLQYPPREL